MGSPSYRSRNQLSFTIEMRPGRARQIGRSFLCAVQVRVIHIYNDAAVMKLVSQAVGNIDIYIVHIPITQLHLPMEMAFVFSAPPQSCFSSVV